MHPKPISSVNMTPTKQDSIENLRASLIYHKGPAALLENEDMFKTSGYTENDVSDNSWWEEEIIQREMPLKVELESRIQRIIGHNSEFIVSPCTNLMKRITNEIAKSSRQETGGLSACRVHIKIATDAHRGVRPISDEFSNDCETCQLGTVDMSVNQVATFEMFVYLFPAKSLFSRLRSFLSKISPRNVVSLTEDFVLVKRKLFRSRNNKEVVYCVPRCQ